MPQQPSQPRNIVPGAVHVFIGKIDIPIVLRIWSRHHQFVRPYHPTVYFPAATQPRSMTEDFAYSLVEIVNRRLCRDPLAMASENEAGPVNVVDHWEMRKPVVRHVHLSSVFFVAKSSSLLTFWHGNKLGVLCNTKALLQSRHSFLSPKSGLNKARNFGHGSLAEQ